MRESGSKLKVNLGTYLKVDGFVSASYVIMTMITIMNISEDDIDDKNTCKFSIFRLISYFYHSFLLAWVIVGSIIFWGIIDNDMCSQTIYDYIIATLITKLFFRSYYIFNEKAK